MKEMDTDGNGSGKFHLFIYIRYSQVYFLVEFDEFVKVMGSVYERKYTDEEMRRAFKCFDTDNSGKRIGKEKRI
jgi:hypothetical protein